MTRRCLAVAALSLLLSADVASAQRRHSAGGHGVSMVGLGQTWVDFQPRQTVSEERYAFNGPVYTFLFQQLGSEFQLMGGVDDRPWPEERLKEIRMLDVKVLTYRPLRLKNKALATASTARPHIGVPAAFHLHYRRSARRLVDEVDIEGFNVNLIALGSGLQGRYDWNDGTWTLQGRALALAGYGFRSYGDGQGFSTIADVAVDVFHRDVFRSYGLFVRGHLRAQQWDMNLPRLYGEEGDAFLDYEDLAYGFTLGVTW